MSSHIYQFVHRDDNGNVSDDYVDVDMRTTRHVRSLRAGSATAGGLASFGELMAKAFAEKSEDAHQRWLDSGDPCDLSESIKWRNAAQTAMKGQGAS